MRNRIKARLIAGLVGGAIMSMLGPRPIFVRTAYAGPTDTTLEEVVMYGIDADTNELLRYAFETDDFVRIGEIVSTAGQKAKDCENLAWVPSGTAKGLYTIPTKGDLRGWLLRINPLDGVAEVVANTGWRKVIGMVPVQNPVTGQWTILASDRDGGSALFAIDPRTGNTVHLMDTSNEYEGLALTPAGTLLGNSTEALWEIDLATGTETKLGNFHYDKVEALEYSFGDNAAKVDATAAGVPAAWTAQGLLFGFDDDSNALMILDPATGDGVNYNCAFSTVDCEGLVFMTKNTDPYGRVVANPCD